MPIYSDMSSFVFKSNLNPNQNNFIHFIGQFKKSFFSGIAQTKVASYF